MTVHPSQVRKLNPEQEQELLTDYHSGELSWKALSTKYGIHPDTISVYLNRMGVLRGRATSTDAKATLKAMLKAKERERRNRTLEKENRKFRSYVLLLLRRQKELEGQVRALGGSPATEGTWRVGQKRTSD